MCIIAAPHIAEIAVCTQHGPGAFPVELHNKHTPGESVVQTPNKQTAPAHTVRKILMQQQQIIAEIEIHLTWIALRKRTSPEVIDSTLRYHTHTFSRKADAPAKIYLLHMGKKIGIKPPNPKIQLTAHHQSSPGRPVYSNRRVILPAVSLQRVKYTSTAIRVSVTVKETT